MTRSWRFALVPVLLALAGCDCSRRSGVSNSYGEIGVVWTDEEGVQLVNRDAVYEFGAARMGERIGKKLVIKNLGAGPLTLVSLEQLEGSPVTIGEAVKEEAAFDVRFVPEQTIGAQETVELDMFFTPPPAKDALVLVEPHSAKLLLRGAGTKEDEDTATLLLKGTAEAGECALPEAIDFGKVPVGERFQLAYAVRNTTSGAANGSVGAPYSDTQDHTAFGFAPGSPQGTFEVPPHGARDVVFEFSPTELRPYRAKVKMRAATQCPAGEVPLIGEGADEVLTWKPSEIDFGYVSPGTPAPRQVVFTNFGSVPLRLTGITSGMPSDFAVQPEPGQDPTELLVPGGAVPTKLTVVCRPSGMGPRSTRLTFATGLAKQPQGEVSLKCYGGGPNIVVMPRPTLSFGKVGFFENVSPAPSVTRKVTVMNNGTKPAVPDTNANLKLGSVGPSGPGQLPLMSLRPLNATTALGEFTLGLPPTYDPAVGLEATAGKNLADLVVTLTPKSVGLKEAELTIYSNDPDEPEVKVLLTADAQVVPPCNYAVSPAELNFGLVTPPTYKDLPVTVTNLGQNPGEVCYLSGIEVAAGSDPAYSIVGGPIASKELQPKESFQAVVRVWPQGAVPQGVLNLSGFLQLNVSSPTKPKATVPLKTSVGPVCLTIAPDNLSFGTVKQGCSSSSRSFTIYNVCSQNVTLKSITVQAGAGQPAGGPNCASSQPCPEFHITQAPLIGAGLTMTPGSAPVSFQGKYLPIDLGPDSGAYAVNAIQAGQNVTYLVSVHGTGDTIGLQTDIFKQDAKPKADILLTIDDSGSMDNEQTSLANNFGSFIQYANAANVDFQIGVTTTDDEPAVWFNGMQVKAEGLRGKLRGSATNPKVLTPTTPNVESLFRDKVKVGTNGSGTEMGLVCSLKAVTPPLITGENAGFLREEANLAIVVVTDAPDQSPDTATYYLNRFLNIKGFNRANMFTFNAIGPFNPSPPSGCSYDGSADDGRYAFVVGQTNGVKAEICDTNWAKKLEDLGKTAFGFRTVFFLNSTPDLTGGRSIEVKIDGQTVPAVQGGATVWTYDPATNSVKFDASKTPAPGQSLSMTYYVACL